MTRADIKHGVCHVCGRRRFLWLPAKFCDRCIRRITAVVGGLWGSPQEDHPDA